jgi:alpha,alpha-trehalase
MVDNFIYLYERYGVIPNFNSPASTGRSQPPFLTSMILDTYNGPYFRYKAGNQLNKLIHSLAEEKYWLKTTTQIAKDEYNTVWNDQDSRYNHLVEEYKLSRYGDRDIGYAHSSELESGWDFTSRFYGRCNEFLPIDLNVYLYKYERDFAKIASHLGNSKEEIKWKEKAHERLERINSLMWDSGEGFFFDYNFKKRRISDFLSLASFTPLWAGMATSKQAEQMVKKLKYFETAYGLVITAKKSLAPETDLSGIPIRYRDTIEEILKPKQWDYPNSWPPLEYLTIIGLLKYGFVDDATRIMKKSLAAHANIFRKYKTFFEKIDGVTAERPKNFHYTNQSGFGWTNAAFYRYVKILDSIESGEAIYEQPKAENPPYRIAIPH